MPRIGTGKGVSMNEIAILRADYYSDGRIIPLIITFSDGKSELISAVKKIQREDNGKKYVVYCSTPSRDLELHFHNSKWRIERSDFRGFS